MPDLSLQLVPDQPTMDSARAPSTEPPPSPQRTAGTSGTAVYGGYIEVTETQPELAGLNRYTTFSNALSNTSIVSAGVRYFLNLVSRPLWKLEPTSHPESSRLTDIVYTMMYGAQAGRTPWQRVVRRAAMYRFYGFSLQEMTVYLRPDGVLGMADVAVRPQSTIERWDVDHQGRVYGAWQTSPHDGREIYLPRWKLVYIVDDSVSDSPEGMGLFRHIAEPVRRLRRYEQLEGWGYETDLRGIPVARAPIQALEEMVRDGTLTQAQMDSALAGMRRFLRGHIKTNNMGMLLDSMTYEDRETRKPSGERKWDLELLRSDANSHAEILRAIERLNREIARILGVEQLLLGDGAAGSFALAKEKNHNFAVVVDSTLEEMREAFQRDWMSTIFALNGWPIEAAPEMKTDRLQYRNIQDVTDALEKLARAGATMMPDDPAINEVRDLLGLSHPITVPSPDDLGLLPGKSPPDQPDAEPESDPEPGE